MRHGSENSISVQKPAKKVVSLLSPEWADVLHWARDPGAKDEVRPHPSLKSEELAALVESAQKEGLIVVAPAAWVQEHRRVQNSRGCLGAAESWIWGDERVRVDALKAVLGQVLVGPKAIFFVLLNLQITILFKMYNPEQLRIDLRE